MVQGKTPLEVTMAEKGMCYAIGSSLRQMCPDETKLSSNRADQRKASAAIRNIPKLEISYNAILGCNYIFLSLSSSSYSYTTPKRAKKKPSAKKGG